jgi:elongation factor Tu
VDEKMRENYERYEREHGFVRVRVRLLTAAEGGRRGPIADGYRADWDIGNRAESGERTINGAPVLLEASTSLAPGESATLRLHPVAPEFWKHVKPGLEVEMREGPRVVGRGKVLDIVRVKTG